MEFRCERDVLAEALTAAARAVYTRGGAMPALACAHLRLDGDTLTVTGTDLETTITHTTTVGGAGDGAALVPVKLLLDIVKHLPPGAVIVGYDKTEGQATVTAGRSEFKLRTGLVEDFPELDWPTGDPATIPGKELVAALERVVPAASTDDSRPILCGVLLEAREGGGLRLVGTDSYRLAWQDLPDVDALATTGRALVPADALGDLARLAGSAGDVLVRFAARRVAFEAGPLRLMSTLIEGEYPNYGGLIPKNHAGRLTADRDELLDTVGRVAVLARESTPVKFTFGPSDNLLGATTQDVGSSQASFDSKWEGPEMSVAFNPHYLADALKACPAGEVWLDVTNARNPALVRSPADEALMLLLMPVRVS